MKITHAVVFIDWGKHSVKIEYFDGRERWQKISCGLDKLHYFEVKKNESQEEFLIRLKDFIWNKYLCPTKKRFGKLVG